MTIGPRFISALALTAIMGFLYWMIPNFEPATMGATTPDRIALFFTSLFALFWIYLVVQGYPISHGNIGTSSTHNLDNIISVAATDHTDNLATFSNYGAMSVDLAAPGVNILSTLPGGGYGLNSGTSMATPHVAGVVALVRDLHPEWTYDQVIQQVLGTVDPLAQLAGLVATGGRLNAAAAVGNPVPPPPPPPPVPLPVVEDFGDGLAQPFTPQTGAWSVSRRILWVQAAPAAIALALVLMS